MSVVKVSSAADLAAVLKKALQETRVFSATNVLLNGDKRKWLIHPKAGRNLIKGTGTPINPSLNMVRVYDMGKAIDRTANGRFAANGVNAWRTLRLDTLSQVRVNGVTYTI